MSYGDLSRYKVVYNDIVLRALCITNLMFSNEKWPSLENPEVKPEYITILVINADGVLEAFTGKTESFQFIPVLK